MVGQHARRASPRRSSTRSAGSARRAHLDVLTGVQGDRLVAILGGDDDPVARRRAAGGAVRRRPGGGRPGRGRPAARPASQRSGRGRRAAGRARPGRTRRARCRPTTCSPSGRWPATAARARAAGAGDLPAAAVEPGRPLLETLSAFLEQASSLEAHRPGRCSCTPTPCATGCAGSTEVTGLRPRGPAAGAHPADGAGARPARRRPDSAAPGVLCRIPTKTGPAVFVRRPHAPAEPRRTTGWTGARHRRSRPRRPDARLPHALARAPRLRGPAALAVRRSPASTWSTTAPRPTPTTIRDTAVAQPLLVAAGLVAALELFPHPADAFHAVGAVAGHSVGEITAAAGHRRHHRRAGDGAGPRARPGDGRRGRASSPTGMTAVLGGDPDEVLAALERHGLTAANDNGAGQIVAAGTARAARRRSRRDPPAKARLIPLSVAGAFHTEHMAPAVETLASYAKAVSVARPAHRPHLQPRRRGRAARAATCWPGSSARSSNPVRWDLCMRDHGRARRHRRDRGAAGRHPDRPDQARAARRRDRRAEDPRPTSRRPATWPPGTAARHRRTARRPGGCWSPPARAPSASSTCRRAP